MFVPFGGARKITKTSVIEFCYRNENFNSRFHVEIIASSSSSSVYLAKTKAMTHLLTYTTVFSGGHFYVTQRKSVECSITKKNSVELKHYQTSRSYKIFNLMKLKPQKER